MSGLSPAATLFNNQNVVGLFSNMEVKESFINQYGERLHDINKKSVSKADIKKKLDSLREDVNNSSNGNGKGEPNIKMSFTIITDILDNMKVNSFPTGSKIFGVSTKESDFDIVIIKPEDKVMVDIKSKFFSKFGTYVDVASNYNDGLKLHFAFHDDIINIIPLNRHDYFYWMVTTDMIKALCRLKPKSMYNKSIRVGMFETISGIVRMTYGNDISYDTIKEYINDKNKEISKLKNDVLYGKSKGIEKNASILWHSVD